MNRRWCSSRVTRMSTARRRRGSATERFVTSLWERSPIITREEFQKFATAASREVELSPSLPTSRPKVASRERLSEVAGAMPNSLRQAPRRAATRRAAIVDRA